MKIDFECTTEFGIFRDALVLPDDHGFTENEIESMKQSRKDAWINFIKNAPEFIIEE